MTTVALFIVSLAAFAFLARLLLGPTVADRVVALDGLLAVVVMGILIGSAELDSSVSVGTVLIVTLVGFVSTSALARYLERRGG